ncbi:MAG: MFS transporter [Bryobacteraceae bacterium]|nr:MFS transporter [Bryobacteraceae bacterium]
MEPSLATPAVKQPAERLRWAVVVLLSLGMVIAYLDRVNLTVALPSMSSGLGLTKAEQGLALSAIFWAYTALQIPCGMLVDRYGVRIPYMIGFLIWSLASAGTALVGSLSSLVAARVLVGMGEAVVAPASMRYIGVHFAEKRRGLAVGLYMTGTKVGPAVGLPLAAFLVSSFGWRLMFLMLGLACLIWLVPWLSWVGRDDPAAAPRASSPGSKQPLSLGRLLSHPAVWGIILGTYSYMYFVYYSMTWMPLYLEERHGMSVRQMGWYSGVSFAGMALVAALAGWAADRIIARGKDPITVRKTFTIAGLAAAASQTLVAFVDSPAVMLFFVVFSLCGLGLATANYWALTHTLMPGASIAVIVGVQNTAANLAGIVAPWLTGWLIQRTGTFDAPIKTVGVWLALGIGSYLLLVRRRFAPK